MSKAFIGIKSILPDSTHNLHSYNAKPIEWFRISFGVVIILQMLYFVYTGFVKEDLVKPIVHFPFLPFIKPFPESVLNGLLFLNVIAGGLIIFGRYIKMALAFFFLSFTYLWLADKGYYNNHYYLMSLLAFLLLLIPGLGKNRWRIKSKDITHNLPRWSFQILRYQWFVVFFIAGINKLNKYWLLDFQPMKATFAFKANKVGNELWTNDLFPILFSYGGAIFDLSIGFLLLYPKTRKIGIILLLGFNLFNGFFFADIGEIGVFPFLVMSSVFLFLEPTEVKKKKKIASSIGKPHLIKAFLWTWILFHFLFPFRHVLITDYVDWTGEGKRFSWRMKIAYKDFDMKFFVQENGKGTKYPINIEKTLTPKQYTNLGYDPDLLPEIGRFLAQAARKKGLQNPIVTADFQVSMNGISKQYIIDPSLPLNKIQHQLFGHNTWIRPLR